jgi:peptidoglycan/xylan/chitin deacetylase (PgdA/CDA1 family)
VEPTRRVLDLLDRLGVRGSFFVLGEVAGFYPDLVREIAARGHEVGCHGFHHVDADLLGPDLFRRELERAALSLRSLLGRSVLGYRAPNLLLRDWMIPVLREAGFRYDVSVCTARSLLGKDFGHPHQARHPYRFSQSFSRPDPRGDLVEVPLPVFPWLRLPAGTGILTRVLGGAWSTLALRHALRTGDTQYYFHPYEVGPRPDLALRLRERVFLRRLGPWLERWIEGMVEAFRGRGVRFVTAGEQAAALLGV